MLGIVAEAAVPRSAVLAGAKSAAVIIQGVWLIAISRIMWTGDTYDWYINTNMLVSASASHNLLTSVSTFQFLQFMNIHQFIIKSSASIDELADVRAPLKDASLSAPPY